MPYTLIPRLKRDDLPETFASVVEAVLEVDRLFWLDPKNAGQKEFSRKFVPGEELPYILAPGTNANGEPRTQVHVQRWGRRFIVDGKPMLEIEDNPPKDGEIWNEDGKWYVKNKHRENVAGPFLDHESAVYAREAIYPSAFNIDAAQQTRRHYGR